MPRTIHIIGAGLAGLAAAVRLAETADAIVIHEATAYAGGRCRSYFDQKTGMTIDNGNHLLLSANHAALGYADTLGTRRCLAGPDRAEFPFIDLKTRERWTLRINDGRVPRWIFDAGRRVPGTHALDYLRLAPLAWVSADKPVADVVACEGVLYDRLLQPFLLAALNVEPPVSSAALAGAIMRETFAAGGAACRPLIARDGLGNVFVEPALDYLRARGVTIRFSHELRGLHFFGERVTQLALGSDAIDLELDDAVILAVPPYAAATLVPELTVPTAFRAILNAHFKVEPPAGCPPMISVVHATTEWIFAFPGRLSVTISGADRLMKEPREALAQTIWNEVAAVAALPTELPSWQIVRERRATFAATPEENAKRPNALTPWRNLILAGDWTRTGLPATIEGAIRSGNRAADLVHL